MASCTLSGFNQDGLKAYLRFAGIAFDWPRTTSCGRGSSGGDQTSGICYYFIRKLHNEGVLSFSDALTSLKQHFRAFEDVAKQASILSEIVDLVADQLKSKNRTGEDPDPFWSLLKDKEELAQDVVIAFFHNPDPEIQKLAPIFLCPLLIRCFTEYSNAHVIESIWRYLNQFQDIPYRKLIWDILLRCYDRSRQMDLLCICFEYLDIRPQLDSDNYLLLLAVRLQKEDRDVKLKRGLNLVSEWIDKLQLNATQLEIILYPLGAMLHTISVFLLPSLVDLIKKLIDKSVFSSVTLNGILDPIIQWFSRPCPFLPNGTYQAFEVILKKAQRIGTDDLILHDVTKWNTLMQHDRQITIAVSYVRLNITLETDNSASERLIRKWQGISLNDFNCEDIRLMRAIVLSPLYSTIMRDVLNQLQCIMATKKLPQSMAISPILFKLAQERDPGCQLQLLKILPEFALSHANMPIILSTIRKFEKVPGLELTCLELYFELSNREYRASSRVIDHLRYLQAKQNKSNDTSLAMAVIIRRMCQQKKSVQNCREMVTFVSNLINEDSSSTISDGVVMVIALDAIQILCQNQTINIQSTWRAIKENFQNETRKIVKFKFYEFFRIIPRMLRVYSTADEMIVDEILSLLWTDLMKETDEKLIENIFYALREYPFDTMRFVRFPEIFRQNVKLPKSHLNNISDQDYTESFPYIPGECWIEMLEKLPKSALNFIQIFVSKFIDLELQAMRTMNNTLPEGRVEPKSITGVQPKSVIKALLNYLVVETRNDFAETEHIRFAIIRCLSEGFSKPLPSFDWSFLQGIYENTMELRNECLKIACRQVENSLSARAFLTRYLSNLDWKSCDIQEILILMTTFHLTSKNMEINDAEILLRKCLETDERLDLFQKKLEVLELQELNADLRKIVEEVLMDRYSKLSEEEKDSEKWITILHKLGSDFTKELTQPLTEELDIKKQVDALLKCPQEMAIERKILLQLVASKLKMSSDSEELNFYGNLLIRMVVRMSKLSAIDLLDLDNEKDRSKVWGLYLQFLDDQTTVSGGINQVFTCLHTRTAKDDSSMALHINSGLTCVLDRYCSS